MVLVAVLAAATVSAAYLIGAWPGLEGSSVGARFSVRGEQRPSNLLVVGIDDKTLSKLHRRWPFPRSLDARAVNVLHEDGARTIVYDVQFTQPTVPAEDLALYEAIARARGVVLATTEIGPDGNTDVLGGQANLAAAHAKAAAASVHPNSSGVVQKYPYSVSGLESLAVASAEATTGRTVPKSEFPGGAAWIDYRGGDNAVPKVSFSDLIEGRVPRSQVAGKVVVVGATSPVLQDVHATPTTSSTGMPGPEVQANAIWTALHGNPLREAPGWMTLLAILLGASLTPLLCLRIRATVAFAVGILFAGVYALVAQLAFDSGVILNVTYPLAAAAVGALGALIVCYVIESWERRLAELYGAKLEATVRERTAELDKSAAELRESAAELTRTQLDAIRRLAQAAELRDEDTGLHIERIGRICELLALKVGVSPTDAERLRIASALHDVGKIGIPDRILLKPGALDPDEWETMKSHTVTGAALLSGSSSALIRVAETIARTHHERWDGSGYPAGLRGREIPLEGRICAICDVFDALSSRRPYKESWPFDRVIDEIGRSRGSHFDPDLVDAFLTLIQELEYAHAQASSQTARWVPDSLALALD
jgi:response regulator RpfG family c-di-GMP phosphodiesterase